MLSRCRKNPVGAVDNGNNKNNKDGGIGGSGGGGGGGGSVISDSSSVVAKEDEDSPKKRKRLMRSTGTGHNVITTGVPDRNRKYFSDLYTTLIDIQWRWNILIFIGGFVFTWILFACFYYFQMHLHGDFDDKNNNRPVRHAPCLDNVQSFTAAYLFSIETMTTIGYGYRGPTEECPGVYLAVLIQSILGAGLQFALASLVVSKTRRAKRRSETILFSKHICVCEQDSCLQLAVRVADMRKSEICGAHAKGFLIKKLRSGDGTFVPIRSFTLSFKSQSGRDDIFFPWPTQLLHTVDEDSPLWSLSRDDFLSGKYELIVVLDGVCGSTSSSFQARKSYHTHEMKWGYRFATLKMFYKESTYTMDLSNFHHTVPASTPLCSAQDINSLRVLYSANHPEYRPSPSPSPQPSSRQRMYTKRRTHSNSPTPAKQAPFSELSVQTLMPGSYSTTTHRSRSMEERRAADSPREPGLEKARRCSFGDLIRTTRARVSDDDDTFYGNAMNTYRYRKSVTDTYLGADIEEDCEDEDGDSNYLAIRSVVSQASTERRQDVRDVFNKRRRKSSVSKLFFGPDTCSSGDDTAAETTILDNSNCNNNRSSSTHGSRGRVDKDLVAKSQRSSTTADI